MKALRQAEIKNIISHNNIETQEELARALERSGFSVTQATVSRDIKEMMLIKVPNAEGGYRYAYPKNHGEMLTPERLERTFKDSVLSVKANESTVVLRTLPGTASSVAYVIDYMKWPEVLGTVAGDDTVFVATTSAETIADFLDRFKLKTL